MAEYNSQPLITAAQEFAKLPGIGLKTAQRLAYYILNAPEEEVEQFASGILRARRSMKLCSVVRISAIRTSAIYARTAAGTTRSYALWKVPRTFPP